MADEIWKRDEIQSPCVKPCVNHPEQRLRVGGMRRIAAIAGGSRLTPEARAAIMDELPSRTPRLQKRRGGRMARITP